MDITKISNTGLPLEQSRLKKVKEEETNDRSLQGDKIEISGEAVSLFNASESKGFEAIRKKIESGYYLQNDVTEQVVDAILRDPTLGKNS